MAQEKKIVAHADERLLAARRARGSPGENWLKNPGTDWFIGVGGGKLYAHHQKEKVLISCGPGGN